MEISMRSFFYPFILLITLSFTSSTFGASLAEEIEILKKKYEDLQKQLNEQSLEDLRREARQEAGPEDEEVSKASESKTFEARGLGLQKLNPEISITGDMVNHWSNVDQGNGKSDFNFRTLGIHLEAYLDPYTRFKAAIPVNENDAVLGEAYLTRYGVAKGLNVTLGKFRQQFGVVNRWHKHGLDQQDFPLALRQIFGVGGLNQTGFSFQWTMPAMGKCAQELTLQITDGDNSVVFGQNSDNAPSFLAHYKNYQDIDENTYFEFGISSLFGRNDLWAVGAGQQENELSTRVLGLDMTVLWEPARRMRYRSRVWRTEYYKIEKDVLAPDGSGEDTIEAWGYYTYLQQKVSRTTEVGVRYDYYEPDQKAWAGAPFTPLAVTAANAEQNMISPYITYQQSPFVKYRLEWNKLDSEGFSQDENRLIFQIIFAAGPHKHERY